MSTVLLIDQITGRVRQRRASPTEGFDLSVGANQSVSSGRGSFRSIFFSLSPLMPRQIAATAPTNNTTTKRPTATVKSARRNTIVSKLITIYDADKTSMTEDLSGLRGAADCGELCEAAIATAAGLDSFEAQHLSLTDSGVTPDENA